MYRLEKKPSNDIDKTDRNSTVVDAGAKTLISKHVRDNVLLKTNDGWIIII